KISSSLSSKQKVHGNSFTAAVRAEKSLELNPSITVTPHVGVRYLHTDIDDVKLGVFKFSNKKTNLVQVPFGVAFNANLKASCGAEVKPFIDLTIAPAFGDRKVNNKVGYAAGLASDTLDTRIADNAMYSAKIGVNATKGAHSFTLNYGIGGANHGRVDQALQAGYRYSF
ncbi:autotransporter outer membrane beta-barrel domain-containing protein, partial [uncultured Parasutterella sp.]